MENITVGQHRDQNNPWMCSASDGRGFPSPWNVFYVNDATWEPHCATQWRAWRWDPAHRRSFMSNGSQPSSINRSVTVHSTPHPSGIHREGEKSSKLLLNAGKLQLGQWRLIQNSLCLGVSLCKAAFSTPDLQIPLWPLACWKKRAEYLRWSQTNCCFKHFYSEIGKSSSGNEGAGEPLQLSEVPACFRTEALHFEGKGDFLQPQTKCNRDVLHRDPAIFQAAKVHRRMVRDSQSIRERIRILFTHPFGFLLYCIREVEYEQLQHARLFIPNSASDLLCGHG